jgi:hypothetical protein
MQIFDVEHDACSLLIADNNTRLMIDCCHNGTTSWRPESYSVQQRITTLDMLAIRNYDEDHASGAADLLDKVCVAWLLRKAGPLGQEPVRTVLTTRCDGRIAFEFAPGSWGST